MSQEPWPFACRKHALDDVIAAISGDLYSGVAVVGPAGIGKSRLIGEALRRNDQDRFLVRQVYGIAGARPEPFGAVAPLLPADFPVPTSRWDLLRRAGDSLAESAGTRSLVLVVDDAHLLDDLSVVLINQLVHGRRAKVAMSLRSGEKVPESLVTLWQKRVVEHITLEPLSRTCTDQIVNAALGGAVESTTAAELWRLTQGNPLFLREMIAFSRDSGTLRYDDGRWAWRGPRAIAPRLLELIETRLDRLESDERHATELLAFAENLGVDLLARLTSFAAVERLESRGLVWIERSGNRLEARLGHPLHIEAVRSLTPALRARVRQRELADAIESHGVRRRTDALQVARWRLDTGGTAGANTFLRAAQQAWTTLDVKQTERFARAAVAAGSGIDAAWLLSDVLTFDVRAEEAERTLTSAMTVPASTEDRLNLITSRAFTLFWGLERTQAALDLLDAATQATTEPTARAELRFMTATTLAFSGQVSRAVQLLNDIIISSDSPPRIAAQACGIKAFATAYLGKFRAAAAAIDRARTNADQWRAESPWLLPALEMADYFTLALSGDITGAADVADRLHEQMTEYSDTGFLTAVAPFMRGQIARLQGRIAEALPPLSEALQYPSDLAGVNSLIAAELAHTAALAGDRELAVRSLSEACTKQRASQTLFQPWLDIAATWVTTAFGFRAAAIEHTLNRARHCQDTDAAPYEAILLHDAVRLGTTRPVADRLSELATHAESRWIPLFAAHAHTYEQRDGPGLDKVTSGFAALNANLLAAEAAAQAAIAHRDNGRQGESFISAARAERLAATCTGTRTPALTDLPTPTLTAREAEIASLAAHGLTDRQIAAQLHLANRTVSNHLHRAFSKLGIRTRQQLKPLFKEG